MNMRILHSGHKAKTRGIPEAMFCGILLFTCLCVCVCFPLACVAPLRGEPAGEPLVLVPSHYLGAFNRCGVVLCMLGVELRVCIYIYIYLY